MYRFIFITVLTVSCLSACSTTKQLQVDANAQKYGQIEYVLEPSSELKKIGTVVVNQRGHSLNLERALPLIQEKAFEIYGSVDVKITNIISSKKTPKKESKSIGNCNSYTKQQFKSKEDRLAHHLKNGPVKPCAKRSNLSLKPLVMITADILN